MGKSYNTDKRDKYNKFKRIKHIKHIKRNKDTYKNRNKWIYKSTEDL